MNRREARQQLMNSSDSSSGGDAVELPASSNRSSPNKRSTSNTTTTRMAKTRQSPKDDNKKPETVALDMAGTRGKHSTATAAAAGDNDNNSCGIGNRNNSAPNLDKLSGDLEKMHSESAAETTSCSKTTKCFIIFFMSLIVILAATVFAISHFNLLGNEDQCPSANSPFQTNQFKLFTTKTTYQTAFEHIGSSIKRNAAPKVFSKEHSLKSIHETLTAGPRKCQVRQLHYFGRHAARFPDREDIIKLNEAIRRIKSRIDFSKFLPPAPAQVNSTGPYSELPVSRTGSDSVTIVSTSDDAANLGRSKKRDCSNPMVSYSQWTSMIHPDQDNLITDTGFNDTEAIVIRLKEIFPQMFDGSQSKIRFNVTKEIRTAQTAVPFIKHLTNYQLSDACPSVNSFPSSNLSSEASVAKVKSDRCLQELTTKKNSPALESHKLCASYADQDTPVGPGLNKDHFLSIANSISENLKLLGAAQLSTIEVKNLYDVCKYETALRGQSIWCNLFSEQDLKFFEYFDDIEDYYKDAFGDGDQARSACAVNSEMMEILEAAPKQSGAALTHLHFTHSQIIRKLVAASIELFQDVGYTKEEITNHLKDGTVPAHRNWRTSLFTPFSANLLFTLYQCDPNPPNSEGNRIIQVNDEGFVVVASLNEHPIIMERCDDVICSLATFKRSKFGKIGDKGDCDLRKLCHKRYTMKNIP